MKFLATRSRNGYSCWVIALSASLYHIPSLPAEGVVYICYLIGQLQTLSSQLLQWKEIIRLLRKGRWDIFTNYISTLFINSIVFCLIYISYKAVFAIIYFFIRYPLVVGPSFQFNPRSSSTVFLLSPLNLRKLNQNS